MSKRTERPQVGGLDWITIYLYAILVVVGWMMVYAADFHPDHPSLLDLSMNYGKQLLFITLAFGLAGFVLLTDSTFFKTITWIIYAGVMAVLLVTPFVAHPINGSYSWLKLGIFSFQPAELGKFATALALAAVLGAPEANLRENRTRLYIAGVIGLPIFLIMLQGDLGSTLVFASFTFMLYREGASSIWYIIGLAFAAASVITLKFDLQTVSFLLLAGANGALFSQIRLPDNRLWLLFGASIVGLCIAYFFGFGWVAVGVLAVSAVTLLVLTYISKNQAFAVITAVAIVVGLIYTATVDFSFKYILKPHQQLRVMVWLHPERFDKKAEIYNINQSKNAIGSGGLLGKGFLKGNVTKLRYVPEQVTDFIFCTVGEEQGFIGSTFLVALYILLLFRIIYLGERQRSRFTRVYAYSVAGILFFHFMINIGMTIGMIPVIGIPLPFLSYGGSSLLSFTLLLFVLVKLDAARSVSFR